MIECLTTGFNPLLKEKSSLIQPSNTWESTQWPAILELEIPSSSFLKTLPRCNTSTSNKQNESGSRFDCQIVISWKARTVARYVQLSEAGTAH